MTFPHSLRIGRELANLPRFQRDRIEKTSIEGREERAEGGGAHTGMQVSNALSSRVALWDQSVARRVSCSPQFVIKHRFSLENCGSPVGKVDSPEAIDVPPVAGHDYVIVIDDVGATVGKVGIAAIVTELPDGDQRCNKSRDDMGLESCRW